MDELWQEALDTTARDKLQQLVEVAQEVSESWRPVLNKGYPFRRSFDEIVRDLLNWNAAIQQQ